MTEKEGARLILLKCLEKFGEGGRLWVKGAMSRMTYEDGEFQIGYCSLGVIDKVRTEIGGANSYCMAGMARRALHAQLYAQKAKHYYGSIPAWNDNPATRFEDVKQAFCKAADSLKEE